MSAPIGVLDPFKRKWQGTVAICSLMRDEHVEDVQEFIAYHRYVGVEKFYMRENGNASTIEQFLKPYIDAGIVDFGYMEGPKHPTQTNWYNECSKLAQPKHSWVAFIDLDEFIIVLNKCVTFYSLVADMRGSCARKCWRFENNIHHSWESVYGFCARADEGVLHILRVRLCASSSLPSQTFATQ